MTLFHSLVRVFNFNLTITIIGSNSVRVAILGLPSGVKLVRAETSRCYCFSYHCGCAPLHQEFLLVLHITLTRN